DGAGRLGRGGRADADRRHLPDLVHDQPRRGAGGHAMTSRRDVSVTYAVLGVFSLIAILPVVGIVLTALQDPDGLATFGSFDGVHLGNFADAWREGNFGSYLRSRVIVAVSVVSVSVVL